MQQSRLLSLPTGICLEIYRYLLIQTLPIRPQGLYIFRHELEPYLEHNLLRTCRQIYDEALPLLYGENVFCDHVDDYRPWAAPKDNYQEHGFPCHHVDLMKHVNLKCEAQPGELDDLTASSVRYYAHDRAALQTFTLRLARFFYDQWLFFEGEFRGQSKTAEALATLGEGVELIIVAWAEDDVGVDALKELRLAVAPEDDWVTRKQYNHRHYQCTGRFWRCGPGKRLL